MFERKSSKPLFAQALNEVLERKAEIFQAYEALIDNLTDTTKIDRELEHAQTKLDETCLEMERMVGRNAEAAQNQDDYNRAFDALSATYNTLKERIHALNTQLAQRGGRKRELEAFMDRLRNMDTALPFDEHTFSATVNRITVHPGAAKGRKKLAFAFRDGTEVTVES